MGGYVTKIQSVSETHFPSASWLYGALGLAPSIMAGLAQVGTFAGRKRQFLNHQCSVY